MIFKNTYVFIGCVSWTLWQERRFVFLTLKKLLNFKFLSTLVIPIDFFLFVIQLVFVRQENFLPLP